MAKQVIPATVAVLAAAGAATAQFSEPAVPTIFLPAQPGAAMTIAYHPGFSQYYGSGGGNPNNPGFVWDAAGSLLQNGFPVGVDVRSWNWNPGTGQLEIVPYGVVNGTYPLVTPDLDGNGFLTGNNTALLNSMPGFQNDQVSPAYDENRDVFWSRSGNNEARQVRRSDGQNNNASVFLDFGAAGINAGQLVEYNIAYDPQRDWLGVLRQDVSPDVLYLFDASDGSYVGNNILAADNSYPYYNGSFANGQYFQYTADGWQGYNIVPAPGAVGIVALAGLTCARRRRA